MFKKIKVLRIINFLVITLCFSLFFVSVKVNAGGKDPGFDYAEQVQYNLDNGVDEPNTISVDYGKVVSVVAKSILGKVFLLWTDSGKVVSIEPRFETNIYGGESFVAHYKTVNTYVTVYLDANNDWLATNPGGGVEFEVPTPPAKLGYTFSGWSGGGEAPGRTDIYKRALYNPVVINPEIDKEPENDIKIGYYLDATKLAFIVDVDRHEVVEMGVIYNLTGDPEDRSGTTEIRATRYSSAYEFSVHLSIDQANYQVNARAYVVTHSGTSYTRTYSRLLTVGNPTITYSLDDTEHLEARSALVTRFMADFNADSGHGNQINVGEIYLSSDARQQAFWTNPTMLTKWGWLLEYFLPLHAGDAGTEGEKIRTMYRSVIARETVTTYLPLSQDLQGFLNETYFISSTEPFFPSINFTIPSNAYHYGNVGVNTSGVYNGQFLTPYKVGYDFAHWLDEENHIVTTPIKNMTVHPSWTLKSYTITYNLYGSVNDSVQGSYNIANNKVLDYVPTIPASIFFRWYDKPMDIFQPTGDPITNIAPNTVYGDITIYAKRFYPVTAKGNIAISGYNVTADEANITLSSTSAPGAGWYRIIISNVDTFDSELFKIIEILSSADSRAYILPGRAYSINVPIKNGDYTTILGYGLLVNDFITFPGTNLGSLSGGLLDKPIAARAWHPTQ